MRTGSERSRSGLVSCLTDVRIAQWVGRREAILSYYLRMNADAQGSPLPRDQVELAVEIFRMLADGTRIRLLWELRESERSVNELAEAVGKPGPAVSQHLAKLRMARMVRTRRDGNHVFYRVENDHIANLVRDGIEHAEHAQDGTPGHHRIAIPSGVTPIKRENDGP